jgi:dephospho-CoA kinase
MTGLVWCTSVGVAGMFGVGRIRFCELAREKMQVVDLGHVHRDSIP